MTDKSDTELLQAIEQHLRMIRMSVAILVGLAVTCLELWVLLFLR